MNSVETWEHLLKQTLTDTLVAMRHQSRLDKDFRTSDLIRNELDSRNCFVIDSADGQIVYHMTKPMTRAEFLRDRTSIDLDFQPVNFVRNEH